MRYDSKLINKQAKALALLGTCVALTAGAAYAQKPPPPPIKGKNYPMAKNGHGSDVRVIQLKPGQKKIDPKLLKTAPTIQQYAKAQAAKPKPRPKLRQIIPAPPLPVGKTAGLFRPLPAAKPVKAPAKPGKAPTKPKKQG